MPEKPVIPDPQTCFELLAAERVPVHIVGHSVMVTRISLVLAAALAKAGQPQNVSLLVAAGMLHDIAKFSTLETGEDHALAGGRLVARWGYESVAEVVRQHVWLQTVSDEKMVDETEIVFYADKRVKHEEIVSVEHRFDDLLVRYGQDEKSIASIVNLATVTKRLEKKIFRYLSWPPEMVASLVQELAEQKENGLGELDHRLLTGLAVYGRRNS